MRELIRRAAHSEHPPRAVLHLGAGACSELDDYLGLEAAHIILVEADPQLAGALRARAGGLSQVEVVAAAVATQAGEATLHLMNHPSASSLHRPGELARHWPNVHAARSMTVPAVTLDELAARLPTGATPSALLVVELQGAELDVLRSVAPAVLQRFGWIALRGSTEALYEGGARLDEVDVALARGGFRPVPHEVDESAWPFRAVLYRRDERLVRLHELEVQLEQAAREKHALEEERARIGREQARLEEHVAALKREKRALEEEKAALAREHARAGEQVAALEKRVRRLESEAVQLAQTHAEQTKLIEELGAVRAEELRQSLRAAQDEAAVLAKSEAALRRELAEARRSAALSTKLQALREADLADLQERYRQALETQEKQRELLAKLSERLSVAAGYFRELTRAGTGLLPQKPATERRGMGRRRTRGRAP